MFSKISGLVKLGLVLTVIGFATMLEASPPPIQDANVIIQSDKVSFISYSYPYNNYGAAVACGNLNAQPWLMSYALIQWDINSVTPPSQEMSHVKNAQVQVFLKSGAKDGRYLAPQKCRCANIITVGRLLR